MSLSTQRSTVLAIVLVFTVGAALLLMKRREARELRPEPVTSVSAEVTEPKPFTSLDEVLKYIGQSPDAQRCVFGSSGRVQAWFVARGARLHIAWSPCGEEPAPFESQCLEQALSPRVRAGLVPEKAKFLLTIKDRQLSAELLPKEKALKLCPDRPTLSSSAPPPGVP